MPASDVLSPAEVASLRALIVDLSFPDTYEVLRTTSVSDGMGGSMGTETSISTGPCSLEEVKMRPTEQTAAGQVLSIAAYIITMPYGTDVTARDRLRINDTRYFEIIAVFAGGDWAMTMNCRCNEVF